MKGITDKVRIGTIEIKNRFIRCATWEDQAEHNGVATPGLIERYSELAKGGVGLIISGNATVDTNDNYFEGTMRLSDEIVVPSYLRMVDEVHKNGSKIFAQLALGGYFRQTRNGIQETGINDMSVPEIEYVIDLFVRGADIAVKCGFDGIELHAAHYFFLSRSISPMDNRRTDDYGGSTEKRSRILLTIIEKIRNRYPDLPIAMRINSTDEIPGGLEPKECLKICRLAVAKGVNMIDISGNNPSHQKINTVKDEGYFTHAAEFIAANVEVPVAATGGLRSLEKINEILSQSEVSLIGFSRPLIRQPELPNLFINGETQRAKCVSCNACFRTPQHFCIFKIRGID